MRLVPIGRFPAFYYWCKMCKAHFSSGERAGYADLEDESFNSYYCSGCATSWLIRQDNEDLKIERPYDPEKGGVL